MRRSALVQLAGPVVLLALVGIIGLGFGAATQEKFTTALVTATIVIGLYVFVGNSGVISFGHVSFVALGAFSAGVLTIPAAVKPTLLPELFGFLSDAELGYLPSLAVASGLGAVVALIVGTPLMRLSGLTAGIATFAVLEITNNVLRFWEKIGPGATTLSLVPTDTGLIAATFFAVLAAIVAFAFQRTPVARRLRATREDPAAAQAVGINVHRERLIAFVLSGAITGLAGGLLVHQLGSVTTGQVYLDLTFITLAMLVVGGSGSLWGAVIGAVGLSFLNDVLRDAEDGGLPNGSSLIILGVLMALVLILRPSGLVGGREFALSLPGRHRRGRTGATPPVAD